MARRKTTRISIDDFKVGDTWLRRDGVEVLIAYVSERSADVLIIGLADRVSIFTFGANGVCLDDDDDDINLVRKVEPLRVVYFNIDADGCKCAYDSRDEADSLAYTDRIARVRVEYRPGQMDA